MDQKVELLLNRSLDNEEEVKIIQQEADQFFLIVMSIIIFFMQCGFAFLEAGSVRSKNTVNILIKNMLDAFIGVILLGSWMGIGVWSWGKSFLWGLRISELQTSLFRIP